MVSCGISLELVKRGAEALRNRDEWEEVMQTNPSCKLGGNPEKDEESSEGSRRLSSVPAGHAQNGAIA